MPDASDCPTGSYRVGVIHSLMPKGVEHQGDAAALLGISPQVIHSLMPKGVEHITLSFDRFAPVSR